jgi:hypothetical protein
MRFKIEKERLKNEVKLVCQEEFTPINERWALFVASELGDHKDYVEHFDTLDNIYGVGKWSWQDNFYKDRYSVVNMVQLVEDLEEGVGEEPEEGKIFADSEQITQLKKEILDKFILSFINDW